MLSGNGRHRRPRQAPALIVAAGVAGSAIAISASAADTATWDKLAECESGGSWSADAGNGYYGGLQLSQEVWEDHGGLDFAPSADQASRSQQISVAEKVLDDQGPKAWPSCAPIAGLTQDGAAADVDPGSPILTVPSDGAEESAKSGESDDPEEAGESSASPSESADPSDGDEPSKEPSGSEGSEKSSEKPDADDEARDKNHDESGESGKSGDSSESESGDADKGKGKSGQDDATSDDPTPSTDSGEGRHRGDSADGKATGDASREGSGRHASRGDERQENGSDGTYTVRSGDNLWAIADDLDVQGGWTELYAENEKAVGSDPDLILPGQSLDLGEK
jgi:nucleoid-associated protein YgaU